MMFNAVRSRLFLSRFLLAAFVCALAWNFATAQSPAASDGVWLGPAPRLENPVVPIAKEAAEPAPQSQLAAVVNTLDRAAVADFYNTEYMASNGVNAQWTGAISGCVSGTTSAEHMTATLRRINYYRSMVGLPSVQGFDVAFNPKCADAALMMIANKKLDHFPTSDWTCYTADGADAAGKSNLAIGAVGPQAVNLYMVDSGDFNKPVGHRRWILYPPSGTMANGDAPALNAPYNGANTLRVIGGFGSRPPSPAWVAWPPRGYTPFQVMPLRWSFSFASADFKNATVAMTRDGAPVTLEVISASDVGTGTDVGYGDNSIVWTPAGLPTTLPAVDVTYQVHVRNVLVGSTPREFAYAVTIIDPSRNAPPVDHDVARAIVGEDPGGMHDLNHDTIVDAGDLVMALNTP